MALTDKIAGYVLGDLHTLTKKIDDQNIQIVQSAKVIKDASLQIMADSNLAVENAREATRQAQIESLVKFQTDMSSAVATTLNEVAGAVATKSAVKWIMGGVLLAGVLAGAAGWMGYSSGKDAGNAFGYALARDETAAASWANTPSGKLARQLEKFGELDHILHCSHPGWKKADGWCYPHSENGKTVFGWRLP